MGRSNKYKTHVEPRLEEIECWCREGLIDVEICKRLGITRSCFYEYRKKYPEFSDFIKKGKEIADYKVENSLFKRATGYEYKEVTQTCREGVLVGTKEITKQVPPDPTSCIFWLKNRKPDKWRDKTDHEVNGEMVTFTYLIEEAHKPADAGMTKDSRGEIETNVTTR